MVDFPIPQYRKNTMVRGNKPKISNDPREGRMLVLRIPGALHTLIAKAAGQLRISMNQYVLETMRARLNKEDTEPKSDK